MSLLMNVFFNEVNNKSFILFKNNNNWWMIVIYSITKSVFYDWKIKVKVFKPQILDSNNYFT
jgi:hypothetical protein